MNKNIFFFGFFLILLIGIVQGEEGPPEPFSITIISPQNTTYYNTTIIDFNVSLNKIGGGWCGVKPQVKNFIPMTKFNDTYFNYTNFTMTVGDHSVYFACNDSDGNLLQTPTIYFNLDYEPYSDVLSINITYPINITYYNSINQFNFTIRDKLPGNIACADTCGEGGVASPDYGITNYSFNVIFLNRTDIWEQNFSFNFNSSLGINTWSIWINETKESRPYLIKYKNVTFLVKTSDTGIGSGGSGVDIVNPDINTSIPVMPTEEKVKIAGLTIKNAIYWAGVFINWILIQISPNHPFELGLPVIIFSILGIAYLISTYKKKSKKKEEIYYEYQE